MDDEQRRGGFGDCPKRPPEPVVQRPGAWYELRRCHDHIHGTVSTNAGSFLRRETGCQAMSRQVPRRLNGGLRPLPCSMSGGHRWVGLLRGSSPIPRALHAAHPLRSSAAGFLPKLGHLHGGLFSRCQCAPRLRSCWLIVEVASCFFRLSSQALAAGCAIVTPCASCPPCRRNSFLTSAFPGVILPVSHAKGSETSWESGAALSLSQY